MSTTAAPSKYQPFVYLAVAPDRFKPYVNTDLYTFHVVSASLSRVDGIDSYAAGYDALAYRPADGRLYGMDCSAPEHSTMVVIDPAKKSIAKVPVKDVPTQTIPFVCGDIAADGKTYVASGSAESASVDIDVTAESVAAAPHAAPGAGGDYDWAVHPKDERLYAVDGDNGSLMCFGPPEHKPEVLKKEAFPKADGPEGTGTSRPVYGAVFFSEAGWLFAIDSAGNAYKVDLTKSEASSPIKGDAVPPSEEVGGGKIPDADKIRVIDAAGGYDDVVNPVWDFLIITSERRGKPWADGNGFMYSWRLSLTARHPKTGEEKDVKTYRIMFDLDEHAEMKEFSDLTLVQQAGGKIILETHKDHFIAKGATILIDIEFKVPGAVHEDTELRNLVAVRLS
jgi:hypothetical protein